MTSGTSAASVLLATMPHVTIVYTSDEAILKGRDAQWYPDAWTIAMREGITGWRWLDLVLHELGHIVLGHPATCGNDFYDQRNEAEADLFAAVHRLPDLRAVGVEIATTRTHAHAARNLRTCHDYLEVRLANLTPEEHAFVDGIVWSVHEGRGA